MTESGSPVSRFLITVLIQYLREIRGSIPLASHHANRGSHRFWMVRPYPLGLQEYAMTDIPAAATGERLTNRTVNFKATVDGLNYEFIIAQKTI